VDNIYYPDVVDISNRVKEIVNINFMRDTKNLGSPSRANIEKDPLMLGGQFFVINLIKLG